VGKEEGGYQGKNLIADETGAITVSNFQLTWKRGVQKVGNVGLKGPGEGKGGQEAAQEKGRGRCQIRRSQDKAGEGGGHGAGHLGEGLINQCRERIQ